MAITLKEAAKSVGVSTNSLIYLGSNAHGKINMWSKVKPVSYPDALAHSSTKDYKPSGATSNWTSIGQVKDNWWRGVDGKCGLTPKTFVTVNDFIKAVGNDDTEWTYSPPTGSSGSPYRLADFDGYNADARSSIDSASIYIKSEYMIADQNIYNVAYWEFSLMDVFEKYGSVDFEDIYQGNTSLGDYYVTAFLSGNYSSTVYAYNCGKFSERKSGVSTGFGGSFRLTDTKYSKCTISIALLKDDITSMLYNNINGAQMMNTSPTDWNTTIYTLPACYKTELTIYPSSQNPNEADNKVTYTISFWQSDSSTIKMDYSITNPNVGQSYTFKFDTPELYFKNGKVADLSISNIGVGTNTTVSGTVTVSTGRFFDSTYAPYIKYTLNYGKISVKRTDGVRTTDVDIT
jgi:hypothetical protein